MDNLFFFHVQIYLLAFVPTSIAADTQPVAIGVVHVQVEPKHRSFSHLHLVRVCNSTAGVAPPAASSRGIHTGSMQLKARPQ